ncbi:MAG: terminase large subunit [Siphoviridae sp. ct7UA22]|nr:MAG: terminase large subunit [Siphoviridae sp. ct7UA22]
MDKQDIIAICAEDTLFYGQYYFPKTIRQDSPQFHADICHEVDSNLHQKIALKVFRGGAKTTLARVILSKRIAFGITRTALVISETAEHSYESVKWLKHAVEREDDWAKDFGLVRGDKYESPYSSEKYSWRDDKIQIVNTSVLDELGRPMVITVVGTGIFGQSRGLNIEDFRPDFILLDDVIDEDNARTEEQRTKVNERVYGAVMNTLAPRSEAPTSMVLMLQTPLHNLDAIELSAKDPEWKHMVFSCFDEHGRSRWESRFPTHELQTKKQGFINRNMLSVWMREMEVTITNNELAYFLSKWATDNYIEGNRYFEIDEWEDNQNRLPRGMVYYMGVDPTPPPKDTQQNSSHDLRRLDSAVIQVIGCGHGHVYDMETYATKSPNPAELITKILELARKWRVMAIGFESLLFARTTKFYLEQEMRIKNEYYRVIPVEDRRKKSIRIRQGLTELACGGKLHLRRDNQGLNQEFFSYPDTDHDDHLDALCIALLCRNTGDIIEGEFEVVDYEAQALLDNWRGI